MKTTLLSLCLILASAFAMEAAPPTKEQLRRAAVADVRRLAAEAIQENTNLQSQLSLSELTIGKLYEEKATLSARIDDLKSWGVNQWERADAAESRLSKEKAAHDRTKRKYHLLKMGACGLLFIFVYLLALKVTQYAINPTVTYAVPAVVGGAVVTAAWFIL